MVSVMTGGIAILPMGGGGAEVGGGGGGMNFGLLFYMYYMFFFLLPPTPTSHLPLIFFIHFAMLYFRRMLCSGG